MKINHALATGVRLALASSLAAMASGVQAQETDTLRIIETVRVSASAVDEDPQNLAASVNSDTFGGGASRPIIRGQTAPRVAVLSDSALLFDASDISPDHAITAEPLLIERIEVLRGPATLLYGSGAIGGIVNVLDKKIPTTLPEKRLDGSLGLRGSSVAEERAGAFEITAQATDNLIVHAEAMKRDADDYRARGLDESRVDGTFSNSENASLGLSWVGERGYIGIAY